MMDAKVRYFLLAVSGNVTMPPDRYIRIGNINTRYWKEGDNGSPVILIHGLIGFCSHFLTVAKGAGVTNTLFEDYEPWCGSIPQQVKRLAGVIATRLVKIYKEVASKKE